jgi:hypothetical protein
LRMHHLPPRDWNLIVNFADEYKTERIAKTRIGPVQVSTSICLSGFSERREAETLIFIDEGATVHGLSHLDGDRDDPEQAEELHEVWCQKVREAIEGDGS